jgi:hypothetical protein
MPSTFTTAAGVTLQLRQVSHYAIELVRAAHPLPDAPTYTTTAFGGVTLTLPYTAETIDEETRPIWLVYQAQLATAMEAQNEAVLQLLLAEGVLCELPEDTAWLDSLSYFGVAIPAAKQAQKALYITTQLVFSAPERQRLIQAIIDLPLELETAVRAAEAGFRGKVRE